MVDVEVSPWLKGLPVAPEYHPDEAGFVDPISFLLRIEEEARKFGICKIVPPTGKPSKRLLLANIHRSIATAQGRSSGKQAPIAQDADSLARSKFSTRRQELGDPSSHSKGASYTLDQFETKAKAFARGVLGTSKDVAPLSIEALFWKTIRENKPVSIEYADNIPGSAFPENASDQADAKKRKKAADKEASTGWNMQNFAKLLGSLLRYMPEQVPGVTSPMIYMDMLFSSRGWNTNHHDLHFVDYLHMGAPKTWYAVPPEAAPAFEDVVRNQESNSVLSPEVLVFNGVPCCRLVQNAGEYVIVFPRAHSINLHHGFGCGETCSLATPGWLKAAKQAAARKILLDRPPLVCHEQLLYQAALDFAGSSSTSEIRSSRLKHKKKPGVEESLKTEFVQDITKNQLVVDKLIRLTRAKCVMFNATERNLDMDNFDPVDSISLLSFVCASMEDKGGDGKSLGQFPQIDWGNVSCAVCGILCYACIVIVKPTAEASQHVLEEKLAISGTDVAQTCRPSEKGSAGNVNIADLDALLHPCIVCPDHALQVCFQLQPWGGSQVLVVYHPEYESFNSNAKHFAEEMSLEYQFKDTTCEVETDDDRQLISRAMEMAGKPDSSWIVRVHSSCPVTALSLTENSNDDSDEDDRTVEKSLKEKKCWVVGRWCGRVWRYDQTHAALGGSKTVSKMVREGDGVDSAETEKTIDTSKKRKEHEEEAAVNCANVRKNCRKKRRTQMAAVWRVESEPRPDSGELTSVSESMYRKAEAVSVKEPDGTPKTETLELQMDIEEPASRTPSFAGKEDVDSNEKSAVFVEDKPPVCDDPPRHSATGNESSLREDVAVVSKFISAGDGTEHESKNRGSGALLTQKDKLSVVVVSQDELGGEQDGTRSASTPCFSNSVWHDVPIAFSPSFHSSYMDEKPKAWPTAYRTPILTEVPRRKRTLTLPSAEKENHDVSDRDFSEMEADRSESDASYSNGERPADDTAENVLGRTRRTKRKSWKALAAEDEQLEKAAKKGSKKLLPTQAKKPSADSKRKFATGMVESSGSHACDFDGCSMSFRTASELSLHKRNICTIKDCAKRLCSHSYLMQHYRVHVDERPLKCPWKGCKKTFKWSWARTEHIRVHTGERPYSCSECGKSYRFVSDFSRHKRTTGHST